MKRYSTNTFPKLTVIFLLFWISIAQIYGENNSHSQKEPHLVQLSGFIQNTKGTPVPFSLIRIRNSFRSTTSGLDGFYTFVAKENDTIDVSGLGYKKTFYIVPTKNTENKYSKDIILLRDTLDLPPITISPWPSKEYFRYSFMNLKLEESPMERAMRHLSPQELQKIMEVLELDGGENSKIVLQQIAASYYYGGGQRNYMEIGAGNTPIPTSLLNPFAWAQFFKSIKAEKEKKKNKEKR